MPPVGFEPTISAGELPQTHAFDRAATGTGRVFNSESPDDQNTEHFALTDILKLNIVPHVSCDDGNVFSK